MLTVFNRLMIEKNATIVPLDFEKEEGIEVCDRL